MEAEVLYLRAIGIEEEVLGPNHPQVATTLHNLALLLGEQVIPVYFHDLQLVSVWVGELVGGRHDRLSG